MYKGGAIQGTEEKYLKIINRIRVIKYCIYEQVILHLKRRIIKQQNRTLQNKKHDGWNKSSVKGWNVTLKKTAKYNRIQKQEVEIMGDKKKIKSSPSDWE